MTSRGRLIDLMDEDETLVGDSPKNGGDGELSHVHDLLILRLHDDVQGPPMVTGKAKTSSVVAPMA